MDWDRYEEFPPQAFSKIDKLALLQVFYWWRERESGKIVWEMEA